MPAEPTEGLWEPAEPAEGCGAPTDWLLNCGFPDDCFSLSHFSEPKSWSLSGEPVLALVFPRPSQPFWAV